MRRLSPVLAVAVLCSLLLLACGSDNKAANAYVESVNKAQNEFASTFDQLSSQITSQSTNEQDQKTLDGFREAVDEGRFGTMVALRGTDIILSGLEDAVAEPKLLDPALFETAEVFFG